MTLRTDFTAAEIVDTDTGDIRAIVKAFDASAVEVEIRGVDNAKSWAELAKTIGQCIGMFALESDAVAQGGEG